MNPRLMQWIESLHHDKNIDTDALFQALEVAFGNAARRQLGEAKKVSVAISRKDASLSVNCDGNPLNTDELIRQIGVQSVKQIILQTIREAERKRS